MNPLLIGNVLPGQLHKPYDGNNTLFFQTCIMTQCL